MILKLNNLKHIILNPYLKVFSNSDFFKFFPLITLFLILKIRNLENKDNLFIILSFLNEVIIFLKFYPYFKTKQKNLEYRDIYISSNKKQGLFFPGVANLPLFSSLKVECVF